MQANFTRCAFAAMLYGALALGASPAWAALDAVEIADLKAARTGDMEKLVIHDEPRARLETAFETGDGEVRHVEDFAGQVTVVNFWATWCPPCREEMPSLDRLRGAMKSADFDVIAISMDRASTDKIEKFYAAIPTDDGPYEVRNLEIHREPTLRIGAEGGVLGLPVTIILDRDGREIARLLGGAEWDSPEAETLLRDIVAALDNPES